MQKSTIFPLLITLFFTQLSFGQSWFSESSNWYNQYNNFAIEGYAQLSFENDTSINDVACKKFSLDQVLYNHVTGANLNFSLPPLYFTETNGVAQLLLDEQFDTIINMNAEIGEFWEFEFESDVDFYDHVTVRVDVQDKDNIIVNDQSLERMMVVYTYSFRSFGQGDIMTDTKVDTLIERVGNTNMFIDPREYLYSTLDAHNASALRCYSDQDIGTYQHYFGYACDFVVPVLELQAQEKFAFFPNPTNGQFTFESNSPIQEIECYGIDGRFIRKLESTTETYDISDLKVGSYWLRIKSEDANRFQMIVKQ